MADFAIVPAGQENKIVVTDQMRRDALAAAGSIDAGGRLPGLFLCQSSTDLVKEGKAKDKDWFISSGGDSVVNVGQAPMFIVLSAQTRYRLTVGEDDDKHIVWDAAKGALTDSQNDDVMAKRAKRYTAFILVHVNQSGIDPNHLGPISYNAKGMSTLAGMKWADAVANAALRGVPPWMLAWTLGSVLEKAITGKGSWNVLTHSDPSTLQLSPALNEKLKQSWQFAAAKRQQDAQMRVIEPTPASGPTDESLGDMADREAGHSVTYEPRNPETMSNAEVSGYATSLPPADEPPQAQFNLPPAIPGDTLVVVEVVDEIGDDGKPSKRTVKGEVGKLVLADARLAERYYLNLRRDMQDSPHLPQIVAKLNAVVRRKEFLEDLEKRQQQAVPEF